MRATDGALENLRLLNDPHSGIQVAFMQGGIANGEQAPDLLSLGRIDHQIFWLFHPADETLSDLTQLRASASLWARWQRHANRVRKNSQCRRRHIRKHDVHWSNAAKRRQRVE